MKDISIKKNYNNNNFSIIKEEQVKNNILNIYELKVVYINNIESLYYFYQKSKNFIFIIIDLEGRLSSSKPFINLIQINDDLNKNIFIIDVFLFIQEFHTQNKEQKFHKLFKEKENNILFRRPIEKDLLYYSALDVIYLYDTFVNMKNILKNVLEKFYENKIKLNEENLNVIIQIISSGHLIDCIKNLNIK